jgi:predicted alpha/beta-hydrolase family hydrolase
LITGDTMNREDRLLAALLRMVEQDCLIQKKGDPLDGTLDSWAISAYAHAMDLLNEAGLIAINHEFGGRVCATVRAEGHALLARARKHDENHRAST